jgi:hypothetical protein
MGSGYGSGDNSMFKQSMNSLNMRDSSYNGRLGGRSSLPRGGAAQETDRIQVRIRGKNNAMERHTGSITRTMDEIGEERKKK